ncbi:hypothetical protein [Sediminibacterium sp. C3]|uniref:hypothetical protein n=1 Tax=Sediminibacterium sp. C3 TaxID=1267211 RepID=UPI00047C3274|nr:hypothetical protein [Sediminibacterium sp. C3]
MYYVIRLYNNYIEWNDARLSINKVNDYSYENLYNDFKWNSVYLSEYSTCLVKKKDFLKSKIILLQSINYSADPVLFQKLGILYEKLGSIDSAKNCYERAIFTIPNRFYPKYLLMNFYIKNKKMYLADSVSREIINSPIKTNSVAIAQIVDSAKSVLQKHIH